MPLTSMTEQSQRAAFEPCGGYYPKDFPSNRCYPLTNDLLPQLIGNLMAGAESQARDGEYKEAIEPYKMVVEKDCCPEDAYREVTKCYDLIGDCASATEYFRRCEQFLRNEPAVAPVGETLNRAQDSLCSMLASHPLT